MKKLLIQWTIGLGLPLCVWLGFVEGVAGARNVAVFFFWAICPFLGTLCWTRKFAEAAALTPPTGRVTKAYQSTSALFILGVTVWTGNLLYAALWAYYLFGAHIAQTEAEKIRKKKLDGSKEPL